MTTDEFAGRDDGSSPTTIGAHHGRFSSSAALRDPAVFAPVAAQDLAGDVWTVADGDLYDVPSGLVASPELVNPGAFEIPGNGIDDDCDGIIDNPVADDCSTVSQFSGVDGTVLARAMDLCRTTVENPPLAQRGWGVVSAELRRSETDAAAPDSLQVAVNSQFGTGGFGPQSNATLAILSTGTARCTGEPGFILPAPGFSDARRSWPRTVVG
jgi:hypothetical protein